jgi:hypothetical protein
MGGPEHGVPEVGTPVDVDDASWQPPHSAGVTWLKVAVRRVAQAASVAVLIFHSSKSSPNQPILIRRSGDVTRS